MNAAVEDLSIGNLGMVVIDELHMIDDSSRGYILELMATKLLSLEQSVQMIGMSATLSVSGHPHDPLSPVDYPQNAELLAKWLNDAKFYVSQYRPVLVEEHFVFDNAIYPATTSRRFHKTAKQLNSPTQPQDHLQGNLTPTRLIQPSPDKALKSPLINAVISLANETAKSGYGALVFCSSRQGCERDAMLISQVLPRGNEADVNTMERRKDLLNDLRSTSTGLDSTLERTIPAGVAFHRKLQ